MKYKRTKEINHRRQAFLLSFFTNDDSYEVQEVNGFILEKHRNGNTGGSEVAIWDREGWEKRQAFLDARAQQQNHIRGILGE